MIKKRATPRREDSLSAKPMKRKPLKKEKRMMTTSSLVRNKSSNNFSVYKVKTVTESPTKIFNDMKCRMFDIRMNKWRIPEI